MIRVLFVCLGNICRSPMAEAVFRHFADSAGILSQVEIDSAGTGNWHIGEPPHEGTRKILKKHQISYEGIRARQIRDEDLQRFDYIIAMDQNNLSSLRKMPGGTETKAVICLLSDFLDAPSWIEVPDPWYTNRFQDTYELVAQGCRFLLAQVQARLKEDHSSS